MGDRIAILQDGRQARPVRAARRAAAGARRRVRRGLRRRRPRAQAAGAAARARRRPVDARRWCAPASRSPRRAPGRRRRPPVPAAGRRRRPPARLAVRARPAGERVRAELRTGPEPIVELDDVLRDALVGPARSTASSTAPSSTTSGKVVGVLSIELHRRSCSAARTTRERGRSSPSVERLARARSVQIAPARDCVRATTASARTGSPTTSTATRRRCSQHIELTLVAVGDRLRDRVRARAGRPPPALAGRADHAGHRRSSTRSRASRSSSCCCRSPAAASRRR